MSAAGDAGLRVLVACETSGVVRRAFADRGHDAWSCDLLPAEDRSNRHIVCDVREILGDGWDLLMVAHPPCTRLCNFGVRWLAKPPPGRSRAAMWAELDEGAALFSDCWNAPIERIAVENPVMHKHAKARIRNYAAPAQTVQPWWFGDPAFKGDRALSPEPAAARADAPAHAAAAGDAGTQDMVEGAPGAARAGPLAAALADLPRHRVGDGGAVGRPCPGADRGGGMRHGFLIFMGAVAAAGLGVAGSIAWLAVAAPRILGDDFMVVSEISARQSPSFRRVRPRFVSDQSLCIGRQLHRSKFIQWEIVGVNCRGKHRAAVKCASFKTRWVLWVKLAVGEISIHKGYLDKSHTAYITSIHFYISKPIASMGVLKKSGISKVRTFKSCILETTRKKLGSMQGRSLEISPLEFARIKMSFNQQRNKVFCRAQVYRFQRNISKCNIAQTSFCLFQGQDGISGTDISGRVWGVRERDQGPRPRDLVVNPIFLILIEPPENDDNNYCTANNSNGLYRFEEQNCRLRFNDFAKFDQFVLNKKIGRNQCQASNEQNHPWPMKSVDAGFILNFFHEDKPPTQKRDAGAKNNEKHIPECTCERKTMVHPEPCPAGFDNRHEAGGGSSRSEGEDCPKHWLTAWFQPLPSACCMFPHFAMFARRLPVSKGFAAWA